MSPLIDWPIPERPSASRVPCPGLLALCGIPCGCGGLNPSHYPLRPGRIEVPLRDSVCNCPETGQDEPPRQHHF